MADHHRTTRRLLRVTALLVLAAGAAVVAFVLLAPPDRRMHPLGLTVILHTGGRLDVRSGDSQWVRWPGFSQDSIGIAFGAALTAAILRRAALEVGRPPSRADPDAGGPRGFPLD